VHALETVPHGSTRVLVENTAGAGRTFAKTAAEVGAILRHVPASMRSRTGYGLDTCHLFSSGYDLRVSADAVKRIIDEFETAAGEPPGFFHFNDSEGELGSNRDRHTLLGEGRIGVEPFRWLVADPRSRGIPLILETPQQNVEIAEDDPSADPYDQRMMALLASFAG
jgi:apurinic endonuclease APN1